ncbi:MAG: c-type cytochrome [Hyphomicrobium sp.]|nr:c-type cytochrome [Hyphomicrobium sp.]
MAPYTCGRACAKTAVSPVQPVDGYRLPTDTAAAPASAAEGAEKQAAEAPAAAAKDAEAPAKDGAAPAAATGFDAKAVAAMVATAKAEDGAALFKKCAACHVVKKDAASGAAPNLWGILNRPLAAQADFAAKYSDALKAKGGEWTYENLAAFIHQPKGYIAGTKMAFAGVKDPAEVANIIAYLRSLADSPAPLPN